MKAQNQLSEKTGKLAASPRKRRELVARGSLSDGGRVKATPGSEQPHRDAAAYVRALLGR